MPHPYEYFRSIEAVWIIWLVSVLLAGWMIRRLVLSLRWHDWRWLAKGEDGASYTLSYVMLLPFFVLLICVIVECSLIMIVKVGTVYAAYSAARSAAVWQSAQPNQVDEKVRLAAVQAMVPFASSNRLHNPGPGIPTPQAVAYTVAFKRYADKKVSAEYVAAKYAYANHATSVTHTKPKTWNGDIQVEVTYRMPFHTPGAGRVLGKPAWWSSRVYVMDIKSTAIVQNEGPRSKNQKLGIEYESR